MHIKCVLLQCLKSLTNSLLSKFMHSLSVPLIVMLLITCSDEQIDCVCASKKNDITGLAHCNICQSSCVSLTASFLAHYKMQSTLFIRTASIECNQVLELC